MAKSPNALHTQNALLAERKIDPVERCWKGAGAHLRPKRTRPEDKADDTSGDEKSSKKSTSPETTSSSHSSSRKTDSKN